MSDLVPPSRFTVAALTIAALLSGCALRATPGAPPTAVVAALGDAPSRPWRAPSWFAPDAWGCPAGVTMSGGASIDDADARPQVRGASLVRVLTSTDIQVNGGEGVVAIVDCAPVTSGGEVVVQASRHLYGYQQSTGRTVIPLTDPVALPEELGTTDRCTLLSTRGTNPTITYSCAQSYGSPSTGSITVDARTLTVRPSSGT